MQIYLSSHDSEAELLNLAQQTLEKHQLQNDFSLSIQPSEPQQAYRNIGEAMNLVTVLAIAVGAGGALTVGMGKDGAITRLVKVLETLVSKKIDVKIKHNGTLIEMSGSAGHIEKTLKELLK